MRDRKLPFALENEPDGKLKQVVLILWDFAHLHGLQMDGCGHQCARMAINQIEQLYMEKMEKGDQIEK